MIVIGVCQLLSNKKMLALVMLCISLRTVMAKEIQLNTQFNNRMLSGRKLIVGIYPDAFYTTFEKQNGKLVNVNGFVIEILNCMAEKHNLTYEYVIPPDMAYGAYVNGSWNGLVGMLIRGEVDIVATNLGMTYARSLFLDFTYAFANDRMSLLVPYPRLASTITGVVRPFHYLVWAGVVASLITVAIVLWLIKTTTFEKSSRTNHRIQRETIYDQLWFLLRALISAQEMFTSTPSVQIIVASWCLVAFVLVQSYTSCLVSYLMAPKFIPYVNNIEELANSNEVTHIIMKYTTMEPFFLGATSGPLGKLGNKLRAHPENIVKTYGNVPNMVANEHKAITYLEFVSKIVLENDFKETKECRIIRANIFFYDARCHFALAKSSPLTSLFNKELVRYVEMGLLKRWSDNILPRPNRCSFQLTNHRPLTMKKTLTLNYLSSAFILYLVGMALANFAFCCELIFRRLNNRCNLRSSTSMN